MASFAPVKGTTEEILATPIVDGQLLFETNAGYDGKIYLDDNGIRIPIGGGSTTLNSLGDVQLSNLRNKNLIQYNDTTHKWENVLLIDWLRDSNGEVQEIVCSERSSAYVYQFTNLMDDYSYDVWITCADGQTPPQFVGMSFDSSDSSNLKANVTIDKVTSAQAGTGGNECKIRLRAFKL